MKMERLIGILVTLLSQEKVTAPQLAEKFEVSRRTISRDIEHLCQAGIPVMTVQGKNGGISIIDGYKIDKTLLTSADMQAILTGLQSLESVSRNKKYQQIMEKLSVGNPNILTSNQHILIDLSSWYKASLAPKIELIQTAITSRRKIQFYYYSPRGAGMRIIEPYKLIFKWSSWYVWGYCVRKKDFRLFKLNRLAELKMTGQEYEIRELPALDMSSERLFSGGFTVEVRFEAGAKWRVIEEFGADSFREQKDGTLLFSFTFTDEENLFEWLLSYGNRAELLKPEEMRKRLKERIKEMEQKYE